MKRANIFWGSFLVLLGVLFFLQAQGIITNVFSFIFPLALILVGGWIILNVFWKTDLSDDETFSYPLQSAKSVRYKFAHGAGQISIGGGAPAGQAIVGSSAAGMNTDSRLEGDRLNVRVEAGPSMIPFVGPSSGVWRYRLTQEVSVTLEIDAGASRLEIDLKDVLATRIELNNGASSTDLTVPARGASLLDVEAGAASINIRVPEGTAARIRAKDSVISLSVDTNRFPQTDTGFYQSPDFESAQNRTEITLEAGLCAVTIK
ncbi:MAG: hypothetical protein AB1607_11290 [Chloroflexota bacterium]